MYRGKNDFKKGYQPKTNIVKDDKGVLVEDSHSILAKWRNFISQVLNAHGVSDVRQTEIHTAKPLVPEPSASEFELVIEKLKSRKSPDNDQILTELTKTIRCEIHKLILSIWSKEDLPEEWKDSIVVPIYKKGDKTDCGNYRGVSPLPTTYNILSNILLSRLTPHT